MPKITIKNLFNKTINAAIDKNIFTAIQENGIDWMHACGAKGKCTTCKFVLIQGKNNITSKSMAETKYMLSNRLAKNERLACQCAILGDITILVPESGKMPHMNYSN